MTYFVYTDALLNSPGMPEDFLEGWKKIDSELRYRFGKPCDPRGDFMGRWTYSLTTYVPGVPRGVYIAFKEDLTILKLAYTVLSSVSKSSGK